MPKSFGYCFILTLCMIRLFFGVLLLRSVNLVLPKVRIAFEKGGVPQTPANRRGRRRRHQVAGAGRRRRARTARAYERRRCREMMGWSMSTGRPRHHHWELIWGFGCFFFRRFCHQEPQTRSPIFAIKIDFSFLPTRSLPPRSLPPTNQSEASDLFQSKA